VTSGRAVAQGSIEQLLAKGMDRKKVQVRGTAQRLKAFIEHLGQEHEIISVSEEFGQMTVVLVNKHGSGPLFELAKKEGVQVRSYLPDRMTLEDYFISAVKEAV
jgi:ABC-type multidrug transport system ATPase subunit